MKKHALLALVAVSLLVPDSAFAWGNQGHQLIGRVAERRLSQKARAEVRRLLNNRSLRNVAIIPDGFRDVELLRVTADWHFVNIDIANPTYDESRDCPSGDCVVRRIGRMVELLGDDTRQDTHRADALIFLVHFVGDLHQPFHAGFGRTPDGEPDRGANNQTVIIDDVERKLHSVWDTSLVIRRGFNEDARFNRMINQTIPALDPDLAAVDDVEEWTNESHRIAQEMHRKTKANLNEEEGYIEKGEKIVEERMALAAVRLARMIENALGNGDGGDD